MKLREARFCTGFADREDADHITVDLFLYWKESFGTAGNKCLVDSVQQVRGFAGRLQHLHVRTEVRRQN